MHPYNDKKYATFKVQKHTVHITILITVKPAISGHSK